MLRTAMPIALALALISQPSGAQTITRLDQNGDGRVSRAELYAYLEFRHRARDVNRDGVVTLHELTGRFSYIQKPVPMEPARRFIEAFDIDRSGGVTVSEIIAVVRASGAFERADLNDDGFVSISEGRVLGLSP